MRELTDKEVRDAFLGEIRARLDFWGRAEATTEEKLDGLVHSILCILDGVTGLPGFIVAPCPHPEDKEFKKDNEENWYPENHESDVQCDISGGLHEQWAVRKAR